MGSKTYSATPEEATEINFMIKEIEGHIEETDFQFDFFQSLQSQFKEKNWLSEKQVASMRKIYERVTG